MRDALSGLVQVQRGRLTEAQRKKLKKKIGDCDREIQGWQFEIIRASNSIEMLAGSSLADRWVKRRDEAARKRERLDKQRKKLRSQLKGYEVK